MFFLGGACMIYKKCIGFFLFLSFQTHCMLTVNQLHKKNSIKKDRILIKNPVDNVVKNIENYRYNASFFHNSMISDLQSIVIHNLDHMSAIQFIRTNKYLYDRYTESTPNGTRYKKCLFTTIPFNFDCYIRALFHYAPQQEDETKILLSIKDKAITSAHSKILTKVGIEMSDMQSVINFYKQVFTTRQIELLSYAPAFVQEMLKKGLSPNAKSPEYALIWAAIYLNKKDLLHMLVTDDRADTMIKDNKGNTVFGLAIMLNEPKLLKILLMSSQGMLTGGYENYFCWPSYVGLKKKDPEVAQIFFERLSFSSKVLTLLPTLGCIAREFFNK